MYFTHTIAVVFTLVSAVSGEASLLRGTRPESKEIPERQLPEAKSILEIARSDPSLSTFYGALMEAGFDDELYGLGPFTVFAPTDDAFDALPEGTLASLTPMQLEDILDYHIVNGKKVLSGDLKLHMTAMTMEGSTVKVTSLDPVKINEGTVIKADVGASNGVIHVIDSVLMPPPEAESPDDEDW